MPPVLPRVFLHAGSGEPVDVTNAVAWLLGQVRPALRSSPHCAALCMHLPSWLGEAAAAPASTTATLTERELQVVSRLCHGRTNKEIARELGIKEDTVKKHLQSVYGKVGVRRRAPLALTLAGLQTVTR
ncbi:MAG: helix-turn-helix transcriptional regulator [Rubrivivax sp.]|nr:helix-turn-helix transcriptional regulator [Rubrivivax sp.]